VILAGILGILSIFTPTIYISSEDTLIWVWNLTITNFIVGFVQTDEILYTLGIVATLFIAIGTLGTLFSGVVSKFKNKNTSLFAIIAGLLLIIGPIIYLGGISSEEGIWDYFSVNVGSILPFFAGAIAILAGVMGKLKRKS